MKPCDFESRCFCQDSFYFIWWAATTTDVDPGRRDLCVVAVMDKFTRTTEILWRKGLAWPLSKWERGPGLPPGQAFIVFLGTLHQGWSSFTMHTFALGGYLLQKSKERMLLITPKRKAICKCKGKSGWTGYTPYLGGLAQILGSSFKAMQWALAVSIQCGGVLAKASLIVA